MSEFLNSLESKLTVMEEGIKALPGGLSSTAARLDRDKLRSLRFRLDQDFNNLLERLSAPQRTYASVFPFIFMPDGLNGPLYRRITQEDLTRWRDAHKSEIRVVLSKDGVAAIAITELAGKYKMTVPQVTRAAQQQGYTVLGWGEYQELLDEIGKLIGGDEQPLPVVVTGIPITDSPKEEKVLPSSSS